MDTVYAWHFTDGNKLRDGTELPAIGVPLKYTGRIVICNSGLHASKHPFDALRFAPGAMLHYVECRGIVEEQEDKFVCSERAILASVDATEMLRYFARMQALSVAHLWDAPEVVLEYLMTGDKALQAAAEAAAWAAAEAAAWDAAGAAAEAAAWAAAAGAAWATAWAAAGAAGAAAWDVARAAAGAAGAAWAAAGAAAGAAAEAAAWAAARQDFAALVYETFGID